MIQKKGGRKEKKRHKKKRRMDEEEEEQDRINLLQSSSLKSKVQRGSKTIMTTTVYTTLNMSKKNSGQFTHQGKIFSPNIKYYVIKKIQYRCVLTCCEDRATV